MADQIHPMTEAKARKMKPGTLAVGTALGLYLVKRSANVGTFILRYTEAKTGKRRTYNLGRYPDLSIAMATTWRSRNVNFWLRALTSSQNATH